MTDIRQKVIGVPLEKGITENDDGTITVLGIFTSDKRDEVGDTITRAATTRALPKYKQWGNIRYMHQPKPVGRVKRIGEEDGLGWNQVEINVIDPDAIFEVRMGLLQALSVGILIDFEELEFDTEGGWIINDYSLAEISLVDHPANYDARLISLGMSLDETARNKARTEGLIPTLRSLGISIPGDGKMTEKKKDIVAAESNDSPENTEQAETEATAVEAEVPAETAEEEAPAEEAAVTEEAPVEEPQEEAEKAAPTTNADTSTLESISASLKGLTDLVEALTKAQQATDAQAPVATEQPSGKATEAETYKAMQDRIEALEAKVLELSTPVERTAAIPTENVLPEEDADKGIETTEQPTEAKPKSLREAVSKYVQHTTLN